MQHLLFVALAFASTMASAQVHRCTMPDGKVVYSDTACTTSAKDAKTLVKPPERSAPLAIASTARIEFSGNPRTDYIKAGAILDSIRLLGRDCEWALKVDKKQMPKCAEFMTRLGPNGEFVQVTAHVSQLNKEGANAEQNTSELRRILSHMEDIVRYKEFALASLGVK